MTFRAFCEISCKRKREKKIKKKTYINWKRICLRSRAELASDRSIKDSIEVTLRLFSLLLKAWTVAMYSVTMLEIFILPWAPKTYLEEKYLLIEIQ